MKTERKMLIAALLVAIMLFNCILPVLKVGATTDVKVTFESELYLALKDELARLEINAGYIDEQRTIIINDEEIAKVTTLSLNNRGLTDLTGLDTFTNLQSLDLSSNELTKDSNLGVLSSLNYLSTLDLSSNAIEDVSAITNFDNIKNVSLHNQKFNIVEIIEIDTSTTSDQVTQVQYALPQILSKAGYLKTEWLIEEAVNGGPYVNWSRFDHKNLKIEVAAKNGSNYVLYKKMVTLRIKVSDSTNKLYNSDINMFFIVVDTNERGIHIPDENMYNAVKEQLTNNQQVNSELISYYNTTPSHLKRNLYERFYNEPKVLVVHINDIINKIPSLILTNKKIEKLDGIEKFVGLEKELDLSGNYIKSIDKLIELKENKLVEEQKLRERVSKQLGLVSDTISKINSTKASIEAEKVIIEGLSKIGAELNKKRSELEAQLSLLNNQKAGLASQKEALEDSIVSLQADITRLNNEITACNAEIAIANTELETLKTTKTSIEATLATYRNELTVLQKELEAQKDGAKAAVAAKETQITEQERNLDLKNEEINQKQADITLKQNEIEAKKAEIREKQEQIDLKISTIAQYDVRISEINVEIAKTEKEHEEIIHKIEEEKITTAGSFKSEEERNSFVEEWSNKLVEAIEKDIEDNGLEANETAQAILEHAKTEGPKLLKNNYVDVVFSHLFPSEEQIEERYIIFKDSNYSEESIATIKQNFEADITFARSAVETNSNFYRNDTELSKIDEMTTFDDTKTVLANVKVALAEEVDEWEANIPNIVKNLTEISNSIKEENKLLEDLETEKSRLQNEITTLEEGINSIDTSALENELALLENAKQELITEKTNLETARDGLIEAIDTLKTELDDLKEALENVENTTEYKAKQQQIAEKESEITAKEAELASTEKAISDKEKAISDNQSKIEKNTKEIEEKRKIIEEKQKEIEAKEKEIEVKNAEIAAKILEIVAIVELINANNQSISNSEAKIAILQSNLDDLEKILEEQMEVLYVIYNRIDKLASFATSELKIMNPDDFANITYEKAKSLFSAHISKITSIEKSLTGFEYDYLIEEFSIPKERKITYDEVKVREDGSTYTESVTKVEKIENPISTYFKELSENSKEWTLSNYKYYLEKFKEIDTYFSMITYCYFVRVNESITTCRAGKYADIEIENLEFDGFDTRHFVDAKNKFSTITNGRKCVDLGELYAYASRMLSNMSELNVYVFLPALKSLNIRENMIENIDRISELAELRELNAYDNEIVDISKPDWSSMKYLRYMDLGFNGISDIKPLEKLEAIQELYLDQNLISGSFDFDISAFSKLKYLDLSENQISDIDKLLQYLEFEARAAGKEMIDFLESEDFRINLQGQILTLNIDKKLETNQTAKIELPKIFRQLEEIDSSRTSFGINSMYGNVTSDGKQVILNTKIDGNFEAQVSVITTEYNNSRTNLGNGTVCKIYYTVGTLQPINVTIKSEATEVYVGETLAFTAEVTGDNVGYTGVTWEVEGATSEKTNISTGGLLTVGEDETAEKVIVRAKSVYDVTKTAEVEITIINKKVTGVKVTPSEVTVFKGDSIEITASVEGENLEESDKGIKWYATVEEENPSFAEGTKASFNGNKLRLTIGAEETTTKFIIKAESEFNPEIFAEAIVTVAERTVAGITITPGVVSVEKGKTQAFTAVVNGENLRTEDKEVTYVVTGNTSKETKISNDGILTIGADEKATTLVVKVISKLDETKSAEVVVTVTAPTVNVKLGYIVEEEYLVGVATKTPVNEFKNKFADEYTVVVKEGENEVTTGYMKTGMFVEVKDQNGNTVIDENDNLLVFEIVVKGDVNSDGVADAIDSSLIKAIRNEVSTVTDAQMRAADIDDNGTVDLVDSKLLLYHRAEVKDYCLDYTK